MLHVSCVAYRGVIICPARARRDQKAAGDAQDAPAEPENAVVQEELQARAMSLR